MSDTGPDDLKRLGAQLNEAQKRKSSARQTPPTPMGIAFRFAAELIAGLLVGGGIGWALDWAIGHWTSVHTKPALTIVFFVLGAAAGIRNIMRAAIELNTQMAAPTAPSVRDDKEN